MTPTTGQPSPLMVQAAGFPLPELYLKIARPAWTDLDPWELLRGEAFLAQHHRINAGLARLAEQSSGVDARVVVPFAACTETGTVACLSAIPHSSEVLLVHPEPEPEILAILPAFEEWLRMAVDDVIRATVGAPASATEPARRPSRPRAPQAKGEREAERGDPRSTTRRHLLRVLRESEVDLDFVAAEAGDQTLQSAALRRHHERVKEERGGRIYADMLFVLTQQRYPDRMARWLWNRILEHKASLSEQLGREAEITVASLDFLNQNEHLVDGSLVLCSEDELTQVAEVALRDGLTGLFDQATFKVRLRREIKRARRYLTPLSLLMLDLDHFKRLNDEHGHQAGDRMLATVGRILRDEMRAVDLPARYGGEEFAVLLPETDLSRAWQLAERLRRRVEERFAGEGAVTVSIGVASHPADGGDVPSLIRAADRALYRSKEAGRNRTTCASGTPDAAAQGVT